MRKHKLRRRSRASITAGAALFTSSVGMLYAAPAQAATSGTFTGGVLVVNGDAADNTIVVSRTAAGKLLVNGGNVRIKGNPTVANTTRIQLFGQGGNDVLGIDEANGALPPVDLFGAVGNDTLTGGSGADRYYGQAGIDRLISIGGGADLVEGGEGDDTVEFQGAAVAESLTTTANGTRVRFDRLDPSPTSIDIGTVENLLVLANGGNDSFSAVGNLAALIKIAVDGGADNDTLLGSNGVDTISGGEGNDFVDGQQGNDAVHLGTGDDAFQWDPGDGSDVVEGAAGSDRLLFNGSSATENFVLAANGARARLTRDVAAIVTDLAGVERVDLRTFASADNVVVDDLSGTDLVDVRVDLAQFGGGGDAQTDRVTVRGSAGDDAFAVSGEGTGYTVTAPHTTVSVATAEPTDNVAVDGAGGTDSVAVAGTAAADAFDVVVDLGAALVARGAFHVSVGDVENVDLDFGAGTDTARVNATQNADTLTVTGTDTGASVTGLPMRVSVRNTDPDADSLVVNALAGDDVVDASGLPAGRVRLTVNGGLGNDILRGSAGADVATGGDGNDVALLSGGDDVFTWSPGDDNDTVEGEAGSDRLLFRGANVTENIAITANGSRVVLTRDIAVVALDLATVERIDLALFGGADNVTVGDLTGTAVTEVNVDAAGALGTPDALGDTVTVYGTSGADEVVVTGVQPGSVEVTGLRATIRLTGTDGPLDRLTVDAGAGDDFVDASELMNNAVSLTVIGGEGADFLIGGSGADTLDGGPHDDGVVGSDGDDVLVGGDGDDVLVGGAGTDTLTGGNGEDVEIQD